MDPAWLTVIISGIPLVYLSVTRLIHNSGMRKISSALLITIAMMAAIFIGDIFAAGEVAFILAIGAILEEKITERAQKGLRELLGLVPKKGRKLVDGREYFVNAEDIRIGDLLRVLPGETIPADGSIVSGTTSVDQAVLTGESLPVDKKAGDKVWCGTINRFGAFDMQAERTAGDSTLQQMIRLVKEAEKSRAPMERIADAWASWLVPAALLLAVAAGIATGDVVRAVTVLVVFGPCALVLATPTAVMAAIGQATKHGVIIKNGDALERMGKVGIMAFDKTGTLTYGNLSVSDIVLFQEGLDRDGFLALVASVEQMSGHPLARAVVEFSEQKGISRQTVTDFAMFPGQGVKATVNGREVVCGNPEWLKSCHVPLNDRCLSAMAAAGSEGKALILAAVAGELAGLVALADSVRGEAPEMVAALGREGVTAVLLTGDKAAAEASVAAQAGISAVHAGLLPGGKVEEIRALQQQGHVVCMVGDGVNDAPALKAANIGVAMGTIGSDIAIESADIALVGDDISLIPYLKRLSNATVRTIRLCIGLSLAINAVAILLSIYGLLNPTTGALVHNAGSVLVVLIAALLSDRDFLKPAESASEEDARILLHDPA